LDAGSCEVKHVVKKGAERANLCVEGGQEIVDEHMLLPQILLKRVHVFTGLPYTLQPVAYVAVTCNKKMFSALIQLTLILHEIARAESML